MKKNKLYIILSCFLFSISFILCLQTVNADSGWDSSYDSDSSWDSGSSWDSDSSWDNDYSWDSGSSGSGYSGSGDPGIAIFVFFIYIIIFAIIINVCTKKSNNNGNLESTARFRELTLEEINEVDATINKDEMDHKLFEIYKEIQIAWMNFDYDTLRKYTTDELFNMYKSQLKVLNTKKQKNIMEDINFIKAKIIDINKENGIEQVKMYLQVTMKDYVVDSNNEVVRGNKNIVNSVEYIITLNRYVDQDGKKKCPSCGATIDIETGGTCEYCHSTIINNNQEFVMSKKECVGQKRVG